MKTTKIFLKLIRTIYLKLTIKLNSKPQLRNYIYKLYDLLRLIEFGIKRLIFQEIPSKGNIIYINPKSIVYEKDLNENNWRLLLKL